MTETTRQDVELQQRVWFGATMFDNSPAHVTVKYLQDICILAFDEDVATSNAIDESIELDRWQNGSFPSSRGGKASDQLVQLCTDR